MKKILFSLLMSLLLDLNGSICLNAMNQQSNIDAKTQNILQIDQSKNSKGFKAWVLANPKKFAALLAAGIASIIAGGVITHRVIKKHWLWEPKSYQERAKELQRRIDVLSESMKQQKKTNLELSNKAKESDDKAKSIAQEFKELSAESGKFKPEKFKSEHEYYKELLKFKNQLKALGKALNKEVETVVQSSKKLDEEMKKFEKDQQELKELEKQQKELEELVH